MNNPLPTRFQGNKTIIYLLTIVIVAPATVGVVLLLENVTQRKEEAKQHVFRVVEKLKILLTLLSGAKISHNNMMANGGQLIPNVPNRGGK